MNAYQFSLLNRFAPLLFHATFPKKYGSSTLGEKLVKYDEELLSSIEDFSGLSSDVILMCEQIHGTDVAVILNTDNIPVAEVLSGYDGIVTNKKNYIVSIRHADCIPLFLYDPKHEVIGLIHAGYKGVHSKIAVSAIKAMRTKFRSNPEDIIACLGPSAQTCCYEIGYNWPHREVFSQEGWDSYRKDTGKGWLIDLPGFVRDTLLDIGILPDNIEISKICTIHSMEYHSWTRQRCFGEKKANGVSIIGMRG